MEWTCECGAENPETGQFCNQCGAPRPAPGGGQTPPGEVESEPPPAQAPPAPPPEPLRVAPDGPEPPPPSPPAPPAEAVPPGAPVAAGPPQPAAKAGKKRGWLIGSLVGLVALLFFCILAAVVGYFYLKPRFGQAADRARQAQAMVTMQAVAGALESYKNASGGYPAPGHNADSYYSIVDLSSLDKDLVPQYIKALPKDPWGHQYQYGVSQDNQSFVLICTGSDGVDSLTSVPDVPVLTHCYEDEIVLEDGQFMQKPAGEQKHCGK